MVAGVGLGEMEREQGDLSEVLATATVTVQARELPTALAAAVATANSHGRDLQ